MKAAKIATLTLTSNIVLSLALISPLGGMGLALASTLSGFIGFFGAGKTLCHKDFAVQIETVSGVFFLIRHDYFSIIIKDLKF